MENRLFSMENEASAVFPEDGGDGVLRASISESVLLTLLLPWCDYTDYLTGADKQ